MAVARSNHKPPVANGWEPATGLCRGKPSKCWASLGVLGPGQPQVGALGQAGLWARQVGMVVQLLPRVHIKPVDTQLGGSKWEVTGGALVCVQGSP